MPIRLSGMISGMDTNTMVQELVSSYRIKTQKYEKAKTKVEWKQEAWQDLNTKIYNFYSKTLSQFRLPGTYDKKKTTVSDPSKATVIASSNAVIGTQSLKVEKLASSGYLTGEKLNATNKITKDSKLSELGITVNSSITLTKGGESKDIALTADMTVNQLVSKLKETGVNVNFDEGNQRFFISSKQSGSEEDFKLTATGDGLDALDKLGLKNGKKIDGEDAVIELNQAKFTSSTNNFSVNGLTISVSATTDGTQPLTLTTDTDVDTIYNSIKDCLKEYNSLIKEMDTLYNAAPAKGYEPLTSEEKEAMSDEEVEKWEKKIKDSILRRDGNLSDVISGLKTSMQSSVEIDGKKYTLATFGIKTSAYFASGDNEKGMYHIDNDQDDSVSSQNNDKLKSMIASDPQTVATFFSGLFTNVYDDLHKKMGTTSLSSIFKVYNDKQLQEEKNDYDKKIDKWETYVSQQEEYWYSKFTAMEKALSQLQSSTSALSGLLGN